MEVGVGKVNRYFEGLRTGMNDGCIHFSKQNVRKIGK
jgi:hypothetical protein